jgi:hypothetical protein
MAAGYVTRRSSGERGVVHALEMAGEVCSADAEACNDEQVNARPAGLPPVVFQLRHLARSLDRLLTYADRRPPIFQLLYCGKVL